MTVKAVVCKEIKFQQLDDKQPVIPFPVNTLIEYERWKRPIDGREVITIKYAIGEYSKYEYLGADFDIENYVEPVTEYGTYRPNTETPVGETPLSEINREIQQSIKQQQEYTRAFNQGMEVIKSMKEEDPYTVQVEMRTSRVELNNYLKTIAGKNIIDIKPLENNCYLVIYKEYKLCQP